jgi:hypothetical protein
MHHRFVPLEAAQALSVAVMVASHELAQEHHRQWVIDVQAAIDAGEAVARPTAPVHRNWVGWPASGTAQYRRP